MISYLFISSFKFLSICLVLRFSVSYFFHICKYCFTHSSIHSPIHPPIHPSIQPSIQPSIHPPSTHPLLFFPLGPSDLCKTTECSRPYSTCEVVQGVAECVCRFSCSRERDLVCGTDGSNYENECELRQAACQNRVDIRVAHRGDCGKSSNLSQLPFPYPHLPPLRIVQSAVTKSCVCSTVRPPTCHSRTPFWARFFKARLA